MASAILKRLVPVLLLLVIVSAIWWFRRQPEVYPTAYVAEPMAILWNANAQVRQHVATLHYGDRVAVLQRSGDRLEVSSDAGARGWMDARQLMDVELWHRSAELLERARAMPVQARGHTRTISNVRLSPGRDGPRIFQFGRNEPVVVLERGTSPAPQDAAGETVAPPAEKETRLEDWLLVLRAEPADPRAAAKSSSANAVPIAGWVLGRFIELDPPQPIPDYFSAAGIRVVAWLVLNTVPGPDGPQPQYLVAGARGGEGQLCDFTLLRVYTWGARRLRYETAYIESDVCGRMPIRLSQSSEGAEFRFADPSQDGAERIYRMRQTTVRRVREAPPPRAHR